ncbi:hypothetical protein ACMGGS_20925 [Superficieibacter sp. BNK-5]|uniref:hypothetical protein n=1 Tax=Superficieibacter sp. BNK-5 TaxID=3376142 RepID=UPI0039BF04E2
MNISRVANYFSAVIGAIFIYFFFDLAFYDQGLNPDIMNYYLNYTSARWSFDIGFEIYQSFLRDHLSLNFQDFWFITISIICSLYFFISKKAFQVLFLIVNFFFIANVLGTQVRFFLGGILFLLALSISRNAIKHVILLAICTFHYGLLILYMLYILSLWLLKKYSFSNVMRYKYFIIIAAIVSYFISKSVVIFILPYTRFEYYLGSLYLESKSLISFLYAAMQLIIIIMFADTYKNKLENNSSDKLLISYNLLILLFIISTSSIAVLSGRYLLINIIMESLIAGVLIRYNIVFFILYFMVSFSKVLPWILNYI